MKWTCHLPGLALQCTHALLYAGYRNKRFSSGWWDHFTVLQRIWRRFCTIATLSGWVAFSQSTNYCILRQRQDISQGWGALCPCFGCTWGALCPGALCLGGHYVRGTLCPGGIMSAVRLKVCHINGLTYTELVISSPTVVVTIAGPGVHFA